MPRDMHTSRYVRNTMDREMLSPELERELALAWRDEGDERALHRLVRAHARLSVSVAARFRRYSIPFNDLVQQGNLGLMRAAEKFDPDNGARFSTYAAWWIRASMQDYILRNWSLVRTGTGSTQKKLFFNLRRVQGKLDRAGGTDDGQLCAAIAKELMVPVDQVEAMLGRLTGPDLSLDAPQSDDSGARDWVDVLEDDAPLTEDAVLDRIEERRRRSMVREAISALPERERRIVEARHLGDEPTTLNELGERMGISKERVRQLEERALERLRKSVSAASHADSHAGA